MKENTYLNVTVVLFKMELNKLIATDQNLIKYLGPQTPLERDDLHYVSSY